MPKLILNTLLLLVLCSLSACQPHKQKDGNVASKSPPASIAPDNPAVIKCKSPRRQMCTREYRPVCATRDTGIHCVTTPCPSTEQVTKSNACTACADEKVFSYVEGKCS